MGGSQHELEMIKQACPDVPEFALHDILATAKEIAAHPNACQEIMTQTQQSALLPQPQGLNLDFS